MYLISATFPIISKRFYKIVFFNVGLQIEKIAMYTITFQFEQKGLSPITLENIESEQSLLEVALKNDIELLSNCVYIIFIFMAKYLGVTS